MSGFWEVYLWRVTGNQKQDIDGPHYRHWQSGANLKACLVGITLKNESTKSDFLPHIWFLYLKPTIQEIFTQQKYGDTQQRLQARPIPLNRKELKSNFTSQKHAYSNI